VDKGGREDRRGREGNIVKPATTYPRRFELAIEPLQGILQGILSVDQLFSHAAASSVMPSPDDENCYTFPESRNAL
jgi:hypothetical protein